MRSQGAKGDQEIDAMLTTRNWHKKSDGTEETLSFLWNSVTDQRYFYCPVVRCGIREEEYTHGVNGTSKVRLI